MRRRHAISPGCSGHYQDLGISSLTRHGSACNSILSVDRLRLEGVTTVAVGRFHVSQAALYSVATVAYGAPRAARSTPCVWRGVLTGAAAGEVRAMYGHVLITSHRPK